MIEFKLYSLQYPDGKVLAKVADKNMMYVLTQYFKNIYNRNEFLVTVKEPRKKEQRLCGWYEVISI